MFTDGLRECKESRVNLNGLTASSIANLIDFAYNSTINIDSGELFHYKLCTLGFQLCIMILIVKKNLLF